MGTPTTLKIFKIPSSQNFYAWFWMGKPHNRYKSRTMGTQDVVEAKKRAKAFWMETIRKDAIGEQIFTPKPAPVTTYDFVEIADLMFAADLDRVNSKPPQLKKTTYDRNKAVYEGSLKSFFKNMNVADIRYNSWTDYVKYLNSREGRKTLDNKTLKNHQMVITKIQNHAKNIERIADFPKLPKIRIKRGKRSFLRPNEYSQLLLIIDEMIKEEVPVQSAGVTDQQFKLAVMFLANSYLRPNDIYALRLRHIESWNRKDGKPFIKIWSESKDTQKEPCWVTPNEVVVGLYSDLRRINADSKDPNDYLFYPKHTRQTASGKIQKQFIAALVRANMLKDPVNESKRNFLVLRHTCAMNAIRAGMILVELEQRMRTSIVQLSQTYLNHANNEENVGSEQVSSTLEHLFEEA
jgi:integrase